MDARRRAYGWLFGLLVALGCASSAQAATSPYMDGVMRKLGRGIANIATGPLEILRGTQMTTNQDGYVAGWTVGVLKGAWWGVVREAAGVYEVLTFFVEIPPGFEPLVKPEYVFTHTNWTDTDIAK
ncbi:MAG: exosortase system-associated protein, TIGR04073 family [Candidatus Omnitrophica bacterium]|nr:exosortase system-associated protein, TIGR04073 family [Candidatus Omnitrophota bacterium]